MKKTLTILAISILLWGCSGNPAGKDMPNIILITIDTLRADHLHCYGYEYETSPNLDRFAAQSTLFEFAYTPIPKTSAAFCSMMTGLHPFIHKCAPNRGTVNPRLTTLAEALTAKGYRTEAVVANANLSKKFKFDQGFSTYVEVWNRIATKEESSPFITGKLLEFLESSPKQPFFIWANYIEPHTPYLPPAEHIQARPPGRDIRDVKPRLIAGMQREMNQKGHFEEGHFIALYDGAVHYVDSQIGRVLDRIEKSGLYENSIVIISADHGEDLGERNFYFNHGPLTFNAASRVPLMIRWPGKPPRRVHRVVSIMDITPTLFQALNIPAPSYPLQGRNLFTDRTQRRLKLFGQLGTFGMVAGHHHYVEVIPQLQRQLGLAPKYIFNILKDPYETQNLAEEFSNLADSLSKEFKAYFSRHGYMNAKQKTKSPELTEKEKRDLKTLGYL